MKREHRQPFPWKQVGRGAAKLVFWVIVAGIVTASIGLQSPPWGAPWREMMGQLLGNRRDALTSAERRKPAPVDARRILGSGPAAVDSILGEPRLGSLEPYPTRWYRRGTLEVVFLDSVAEWLTYQIEDAHKPVPFGSSALELVGLSAADLGAPDFKNQVTLRWDRAGGLRRLAVNGDASGNLYFIFINRTVLPSEIEPAPLGERDFWRQ